MDLHSPFPLVRPRIGGRPHSMAWPVHTMLPCLAHGPTSKVLYILSGACTLMTCTKLTYQESSTHWRYNESLRCTTGETTTAYAHRVPYIRDETHESNILFFDSWHIGQGACGLLTDR